MISSTLNASLCFPIYSRGGVRDADKLCTLWHAHLFVYLFIYCICLGVGESSKIP